MADSRKRPVMNRVSAVVDRAISKQVKLQEARREFHNFLSKNPEFSDESSGDSGEYFRHFEDLRVARLESEAAIKDLNTLLETAEDVSAAQEEAAARQGPPDSSSGPGACTSSCE